MPGRVLIADDSPVARVTVARRVRAEGREVVEEGSARTASSVDARTLACALLDLDLGDGDGAEVARSLRAASSSLPIAFFTTTTSGDALERARAFGPVFAKPDELDRAVAWIRLQID